MGVCLRCIQENIILPSRLILAYPALDLRPVISPSRLLFLMDTFAPMNLMHQFRYVSFCLLCLHGQLHVRLFSV